MGTSRGSAESKIMTDNNITPLVDVVLVLLILMMVTANAMATKSIPMELPKASSGQLDASKQPLLVSVDESGALFLDAVRVDDAAIRARVREATARNSRASAVLAADARTRHESVVHALDLLRSEGVSKIAIVVKAAAERP